MTAFGVRCPCWFIL